MVNGLNDTNFQKTNNFLDIATYQGYSVNKCGEFGTNLGTTPFKYQ
jgi:hypothetical protein